MSELEEPLKELARAPVLLVASDYDGTLAPIVPDPSRAPPNRETLVALRTIASLPQTHVAVISGRALRDLASLLGVPEDVHLVGSHGSEFDPDFSQSLSEEQRALLSRVRAELAEIATRDEGFLLEEKPASVAFHYRNASEEQAERALEVVLRGPAAVGGVFTKHGKKVLELGVMATHKGGALERVRHRVGASAVLFLGDDRTDEDAFETLTGPDVGVKVGDGETVAPYRVTDTMEVAQLLSRLCELREEWLAGSEAVPIEGHAILSDQRTVALVSPEARIVWLCLPRIDSSALFAELLGGPAAGHFSIRPAESSEPLGQRYADDSFLLKTEWQNLTLTDFLDCSDARPRRRAGRTELVRIVEGSGRVMVEFAPRLDFGRVPTRIGRREGGLQVEDSLDPIVLRAPAVEWDICQEGPHQTARAEIEVKPDRPLIVELRYGTGSLRNGTESALERRPVTERYWLSWAAQLRVPSVEPNLVRRSALALKALCYEPTGAIVAAGTTSLPEHVGGIRNWDYRYCWLRDAAMSVAALAKLGSENEAMRFLDWMLSVLDRCESPERLQPVYSVTGGELHAEAEIAELPGYRGSRPVRVSNAAARQVQLDVFGPVAELIHLLLEQEAPLSSEHWRLTEALVEAIAQRWREPDHGIWEIRRPRRHHVHSKVMCWLTVDQGIKIARAFLEREREDWKELRKQIAEDVLEKGWKNEAGAFTAAYDGYDLDAAALCIGLSGLLPAKDPRYRATVDAVATGLRSGPTVYRYRADDGLPGYEGGFHICASWLVQAYLLVGRRDEAWTLFRDLVALAGPTGLLSEQYGPKTRRALGNHPQAYSHLGLIECALALAAGDDG